MAEWDSVVGGGVSQRDVKAQKNHPQVARWLQCRAATGVRGAQPPGVFLSAASGSRQASTT